MSNYDLIINLSKFVIPSIVFFGAAYYFTNKWYDIQSQRLKVDSLLNQPQKGESTKENEQKNTFFPLQLDAVQRLVLFLERISPNNIVIRLHNPGLPAQAFQQKLLETIRTEYEHNLAQQVFISSENWEIVKSSKEEVVKIINMAATKLEPTALAGDLGKAIFEITSQLKNQPTDMAVEGLKQELRKNL